MATPIDAVILAWFKQEKSRLVEYNRLGFPPRAIRGKYGPFRFDGPRVTQRDGTQFATLLESDGKMFVLLELPNFFTVDLHRMMHRLMEGQGVTVLTMPSGVLSSAEVSVGSIEVIDQGRPRPLRARPQLIKANVRVRWTNSRRSAYFLSDNTNHRGDQVITQGGLTYVRGTVRHRPLGRKPDHRRLHLGGHWHICVKNTVPIVR